MANELQVGQSWGVPPYSRVATAKQSSPRRTARSFDPEVASAFGSVVRMRREALGLAQDAFALTASVDRSYFGKLERGERQPTLALILRIARGLGVPAYEIMKEVEFHLRKRTKSRET